jgi:hypothetical protein
MNTPSTKASNRPQSRRTEERPSSYTVTSPRGLRLLVRRPDGRPTRVRSRGGVVTAARVASVQSYLQIPGA